MTEIIGVGNPDSLRPFAVDRPAWHSVGASVCVRLSVSWLYNGAVEFAPAHLSVRIRWHDTDWTGRVCDSPGENHFCAVLKNVKENKNSETETDDSGQAWADLPRHGVPPCALERAGFMRASVLFRGSSPDCRHLNLNPRVTELLHLPDPDRRRRPSPRSKATPTLPKHGMAASRAWTNPPARTPHAPAGPRAL